MSAGKFKQINSEYEGLVTSGDLSSGLSELSSDVVHVTGTETINGVKTFTNQTFFGNSSTNSISIGSANIFKGVNGVFTSYSLPSAGGTLELQGHQHQLRYALVSPTITTSTTDVSDDTVSATLQDRAINSVTLGSGIDYATFTFPEVVSDYARDFMLRLTITGSTVPTITFQEPDETPVSFDVADDEWTNIEQGVNILMFTETSQPAPAIEEG